MEIPFNNCSQFGYPDIIGENSIYCVHAGRSKFISKQTNTLKSQISSNIRLGLKLLVRMCSDLGLKEASGYAMELKKAEKSKELRERIGSSRSGSRRSSGRSSRGGLSPSADSPLPPTRGGSGSQSSLPPPTRDSIRDSISSQRIAKMQLIESSGDPFSQQLRDIDASYSDPLGPLERPRTAAGSRRNFDDEFADEEIGDDLLPE